jgi:hypothetical protein
VRPLLASLLIAASTVSFAHHAPQAATSLVDFYSPQRQDRLFGDRLPLLAEYRKAGAQLAFAAVVHSSDPKSATFRMLAAAFQKHHPAAVLLEGFPTGWGPNPPHIMSKVTGAVSGSSYDVGEDMYAARMAAVSGAVVWGAEPDDAEIAAALHRIGFSARDVFFASMFGPLAQDLEAKVFTEPDGPAFEKSYHEWATINAKAYDPTVTLDSSAFRTWFLQHYGSSLEQDASWSERGGPGQPGIAGKIGRASNRVRDQHMFELATRLAKQDKRVLIVAGGSHLSSQWRALKATFGTPVVRGSW